MKQPAHISHFKICGMMMFDDMNSTPTYYFTIYIVFFYFMSLYCKCGFPSQSQSHTSQAVFQIGDRFMRYIIWRMSSTSLAQLIERSKWTFKDWEGSQVRVLIETVYYIVTKYLIVTKNWRMPKTVSIKAVTIYVPSFVYLYEPTS